MSISLFCFSGPAFGKDKEQDQGKVPVASPPSIYTFAGDLALASKYIWRGQRATNDWSLQPSATVGIGGFSFNAWGTVNLTAANEGDSLFLPENPGAPAGNHSGLKGKFTELNYVFSYAHSFENVSIDVGTITYAFPDRAVSLPSTTEIYGGISLDSVPLAPAATLYVDVDESRNNGGTTGVYFTLGASHSIPLGESIL